MQLDAPQRQRWQEEFRDRKHGLQAEIASTMEAKGLGAESSNKTQLSRFFKGEEAGLRYILEDPDRAECVAKALGLEGKDELDQIFARISGWTQETPVGFVHLPGFEDFPPAPVQDTYFKAPVHQVSCTLPFVNHFTSSTSVEEEKLVEYCGWAVSNNQPLTVLIMGEKGSGKSFLLEYLSYLMSSHGIDHMRQDDVDHCSIPEQTRLMKGREAFVFLCASTRTVEPGTRDRIVIRLRQPTPREEREYSSHLIDLLKRFHQIDLVSLGEQPSFQLAPRNFLVLGFLLRRAYESGQWSKSITDLHESLYHWRWFERGVHRAQPEHVELVRRYLPDAIASFATDVAYSTGELSQRLANLVGESPTADLVEGITRVLVDLEERGAFARDGGSIEVRERWLELMVLSRQMLGSRSRFIEVMCDPNHLEALIFTVREVGWEEVCKRLDTLDDSERIHCFGAITFALAHPLETHPSATRWFEHALAWWINQPAPSNKQVLTVGSSDAPPPRQAPNLPGGTQPLLLCARASMHHLPEDWGAGLSGVEEHLTPNERHWLERMFPDHQPEPGVKQSAFVVGTPLEASLEDVLAALDYFGEPDLILDSQSWRTWWQEMGPQIFKGQCMLARYGERTVPVEVLHETPAKVWTRGVVERLNRCDEDVMLSYTRLIVSWCDRGGREPFEGLKQAMDQLRPKPKLALKEHVKERLPAISGWFGHDEFMRWMLWQFTEPKNIDELFLSYAEANPRRLVWRAFEDMGLSITTLLDYALGHLEDVPGGQKKIEPTGGGDGPPAIQFFQPAMAPGKLILEAIIERANMDELSVLYDMLLEMDDAPEDIYQLTFNMLFVHAPSLLAAKPGIDSKELHSIVIRVLNSLTNVTSEELERWRRLADDGGSLAARIGACLVSACASTDGSRCEPLRDALILLNELVRDDPIEVSALWLKCVGESIVRFGLFEEEDFIDMFEDLVWNSDVVGPVLWSHEIDRYGDIFKPWWCIAVDIEGEAEVIARLDELHDPKDAMPNRIRIVGLWHAFERIERAVPLVEGCLDSSVVGDDALSLCKNMRYWSVGMREGILELYVEEPARWGADLEWAKQILFPVCKSNPERFVYWCEKLINNPHAEEHRLFWEGVLRAMPHSIHRMQITPYLFAPS